jgi:DNA mismatch repair protein MutL
MKLSAISRPAPSERMTAEEYRSRSAAASEKRMTHAFVPVEDRVSGPSPVKQLQITDPPLRTSAQAPVAPPVREVPIREQTVSPIRMPEPEKTVENPAVLSPRRTLPSSAVAPEVKAPRAESARSPISPLQTPSAEKAQVISEDPAPPFAPVTPTAPTADVPAKALEAGELRIEIPVSEEHALPTYRIIGEAFHSYVLVERYDSDNPVLLLVDKHAAHERIIFEQLKARMQQHGIESSESASQILMFPVEFMLTASEIEVLKQYRAEIEAIGFAFEAGVHTVRVSEIPGGIGQDAVESFFGVVAGRLLDQTGDVVLTRDILFEKALYQGACKAAIKAGRAYVDEHVDYIIKCLMEIPDITFCPHGRPVAMELSKKKIDHQFKRS